MTEKLLDLNDLEVGKTYRPVGSSFSPDERRTVKYKGTSLLVTESENGVEVSHRLGVSYVEYEEIVPYFEVGKIYKYNFDKTTSYEITAVHHKPEGRTVDCIERSIIKDVHLVFSTYTEVEDF